MATASQAVSLTNGRLLARNTIWNLLGQILPMAVGLITIPLLVRGMGVERFGVLSLAWVVVGYFSLFDLGIGRALTKLVADKLGANQEHAIPPLAWTSLAMMLLLGVFGALVTLILSPWLVERLLRIPQSLQSEALRGFYVLAASIPMVTATAGLRGILDALQRFRIANLIRIPMSVFSFVAPLLVFPFSHSLVPIISVLVAGRLVGCLVHLLAALQAMPILKQQVYVRTSLIMPALRLGGWMTVSNLVGPIMSYLDRFLIGAVLSIAAVSYYAAPADMMSRVLVIPTAIAGVLFPALALSLQQDKNRAELIFSRGVKWMFLVIFPLTLLVVTLAPEGLRLWLGTTFSENGTPALRWLAAGTLLNCLAFVPFALLQAAGRPRVTGMLNLMELPLYLVALWFLVKTRGIEGAAIAWAGRVSVDAVLMYGFAHRLVTRMSNFLLRLAAGIAGALSLLCVFVFLHGLTIKLFSLSICLVAFGLIGWFWILTPEERKFFLGMGPVPAMIKFSAVLPQSDRMNAR